MKGWLKGGLIVAGIDLLFWLYIFLRAVTCSGDMCGLGAVVAIYYGIPSLILAFIIGAVIGAVSGIALKSEKKVITKSSKIGFGIGLFISILIFTLNAWSTYISHKANVAITHLPSLIEYFPLPLLLILILIPFVSAWIIWVISGLIKK
jgi:hypothetical protein